MITESNSVVIFAGGAARASGAAVAGCGRGVWLSSRIVCYKPQRIGAGATGIERCMVVGRKLRTLYNYWKTRRELQTRLLVMTRIGRWIVPEYRFQWPQLDW